MDDAAAVAALLGFVFFVPAGFFRDDHGEVGEVAGAEAEGDADVALAAVAALLLSRVTAGGVTILLAAIAAAGLGVALDRFGTGTGEGA